MRTKLVRTVVVSALACFAFNACDDNPVSEGRDATTALAVNPSFALVDAADTTRVSAFGVNQYNEKTYTPVTGTACDAKIQVDLDVGQTAGGVVPTDGRVPVEPPDRWLVVGQTLGETCINFSGGGQTAEATLFVVPSTMEATISSVIGSGASATAVVDFFDKVGDPVTGMDAADLSFSVANSAVADVDETGTVTGKAPGSTDLVVELGSQWAAPRSTSVSFTVTPGAFPGTVAPATANWGDTITISAAAGTFDDDTDVTFDGLTPYLVSFDESSEFVVVGPAGMGGSPSEIVITGAGENQLAYATTIEVPNPDPNDANEPNNAGGGGGLSLGDLGETTPATLPFEEWITTGGLDVDDVFQITLAAAAVIDVVLDWNYTDIDMDVLLYDGAGDLIFDFGCASTAVPETCSFDLAAGTWYIDVNVYDTHGVSEWATTLLKMTPQ
ncbi:MAG: PPC domain-containing protein [Gemmatimonadota bacterium]|nr:MAG: PPC domain-containing protein [Gemmatimonadota bacterium]